MSCIWEYTPIQNKNVTCRKAHSCEWCGEAISIGELAHYRVYVFEGDFCHGWMYLICETAMLTAPIELIQEGWDPGMFKRGSHEE